MTSLQSHLPVKLIRALYGISREKNPQIRSRVLEASLKEVLRWFTVTARQLLQGIIHIPHQTKRFFDRNKVALTQLADPRIDTQTKKQIILKPGGSGSLGGVIIRSLLKWNPNAPKVHLPKSKVKRNPKKKKSNVDKTKSQKKKSPQKQKSPAKKKSPQKTSRKRGTSARTQPYTRKPRLATSSVTASPVASESFTSPLMTPRTERFLETLIKPVASGASPSPLRVMPAKSNLSHVFPNLMKHWKSASPKTSPPPVTPSSTLATVAAAHKVPAPKVQVQERSGMLKSLLDLSKQELSRSSPLRTPSRRVLPVMKLIRRQDNQWRRIPV